MTPLSWILGAFLLASSSSPLLHLPHDDAQSVACGLGGSGELEIVVAANAFSKVLRSDDLGLSWSPVAGDGLEFRESFVVEWDGSGAEPRFWIGTDRGVWSYAPATGEVRERSVGLDPADRRIADLAAPLRGGGPVALATTGGRVHLWDEAAQRWEEVLASGDADLLARVAVAPDFDPAGAATTDRTVLAAVAGRLHRSTDGGVSWNLVAPFDGPAAATEDDWWIAGLALAEDFATSGVVLLGRGRADAASPTGEAGELWRSDDHGASFGLATATVGAVRRLAAAPPDAAGTRAAFAVMQAWPEAGAVPGVLRSDDGGLSWSDQGSAQDFCLEDEDELSLAPGLERLMGLAVSPRFAQDGVLLLARGAGLYRSRDGGARWRGVAIRPPSNVRELGLALDADGSVLAFGATNGGGFVRADLDGSPPQVLDESPIHFARAVAPSSNHAVDGGVALAGEGGVAAWFDPARPPANPFGLSGLLFGRGPRNIRHLAGHPALDFAAPPSGGSGTLFWSYLTPAQVIATDDGGRSLRVIDRLVDGSPAPYMRRLAVSRSYDPSRSGGRTDVYGFNQRYLFRLEGDAWNLAAILPTNLFALAVDPDFARPALPRLFVGELARPVVSVVLDQPGGAVVQELPSEGLDGQVRGLAVPPDFARRPVLYAAVWGAGVRKLDLAAAQPRWEPVGSGFPALWCDVVRLSPAFEQDRTLVVGTQRGLWTCTDSPGAAWTEVPAPWTVDDDEAVLQRFAPGAPGNPDPARPWPWETLDRWTASLGFGVPVVGMALSWTDRDGAAVEWEGHATRIELRSFAGPAMGEVVLSAFDHADGSLVATTTVDLRAPKRSARRVPLDLPARRAVTVRAEARLDAGEVLVLDAFTIHP